MACSAHVMRLLDPNRTELEGKVEEYQAECVRLLISFLGKFEYAVQEEEVIVTMTILRMLEQYDECHIDRQHHLVPDAFMHMGKDMLSSTLLGGLLQTTFYSYVRTDIRMAILGQCGTRISLDRWPLDEDSPSSDADWANRMTWLLVHAINLCYDSAASGVMPHEQLVSLVEKWKAEVPSSFEPYFHSQGSRDAFPVMRFVCPWHGMFIPVIPLFFWFCFAMLMLNYPAVGMQFYHASRILLAARRMADQHFRDVLHFNNNMKVSSIKRIPPHIGLSKQSVSLKSSCMFACSVQSLSPAMTKQFASMGHIWLPWVRFIPAPIFCHFQSSSVGAFADV